MKFSFNVVQWPSYKKGDSTPSTEQQTSHRVTQQSAMDRDQMRKENAERQERIREKERIQRELLEKIRKEIERQGR